MSNPSMRQGSIREEIDNGSNLRCACTYKRHCAVLQNNVVLGRSSRAARTRFHLLGEVSFEGGEAHGTGRAEVRTPDGVAPVLDFALQVPEQAGPGVHRLVRLAAACQVKQ